MVNTPIDRKELAENLGRLPDATSRADLELLALAMRSLTAEQRPFFAYELVHNNLMIFQDPLLRPLIEAAREKGVLAQAIGNMTTAFPQLADDLIEQAAFHCLEGKNETDPASAGGWNQDEVAKCYASLYVARDGLTIPFGANIQ